MASGEKKGSWFRKSGAAGRRFGATFISTATPVEEAWLHEASTVVSLSLRNSEAVRVPQQPVWATIVKPEPAVLALLLPSPKNPAVAFPVPEKAESVTVKEVVEVAVFCADWTTAAEPFVPLVSTLPNSTIDQVQFVCVCPPKSKVTVPEEGEDPRARNTVVRRFTDPCAEVFTSTQVRPFPDAVGSFGAAPAELVTAARMSLFAVGVMLAVL
jgi:hypothetical protein